MCLASQANQGKVMRTLETNHTTEVAYLCIYLYIEQAHNRALDLCFYGILPAVRKIDLRQVA